MDHIGKWGQWYLLGVFAIFVVALLVYEGMALANRTEGDTISEFIWAATRKYPIIPLLIGLVTGILYGHFFWQRGA